MAKQPGRLRSLAAGVAARTRLRGSAPRARVDTCWLLTDGSVCVDGWLVERDGLPGAVEARIVRGGRTGAWSPLLRKDRPDVAAHVVGPDASRSDFGIVGRVAGPLDAGTAIELRSGDQRVRVPVGTVRRDAVPEEAFAGISLPMPPTVESLRPVVDVVRWSAERAAPSASVAYRHAGMTGAARVGIVVPVYGDDTYVRNLLRALADGHDGVEVTFVCDDPDLADALVSGVRTWNDAVYDVPVQVLVHDRNAGFAAACNTGWRATAGDLVLLLNSDVLVAQPAHDIACLADAVTSGVAATAPVLVFPDGTLQHAGMEMVDPPDFPGFVLPGHPGKHGPADGLGSEPFDVPMLTGAAICVRRADLDAVGGVPTVYGRGDFEDVLLSLALRDRGRLVVDPGVRWTHIEGVSYRRDLLGGIAMTLAKSVAVGERTGGRR